MQLNPYLHFPGTCEAAFKFYEKNLGGKIVFKITYGEAPAGSGSDPAMANQIMHARVNVGGNALMGSDCSPERYAKPQGFTISISIEQPEEAERIFAALSESGTIMMPIAETFWAKRFGMLVDQFGIPWMINCEKPMQ